MQPGKEPPAEDAIAELFEVPPQEFTRRRNALAKELKERGDKEAAERVGALKRPTLPLWAVNQLSRRDRETVDELIGVQRELAEAGGPDELQRGSARRRRLVGELTERARDLLLDAGLSASSQTIERIRSTLLAVNTPEEEQLLRRGRLERELEASGFEDAFAGLDISDLPEPESDKEAEREAERLAGEARQARSRADSLAEEAARLTADARNATEKALEAEARATELEKRAEAARKRL